MRQIAVIGSARLAPAAEVLAEELGGAICHSGYSLVCGGLAGVMAAACRGFKATIGQGVTVGILPGTDPAAANDWVDVVIPTGMDIGRNGLVVAAGLGVIAYGGGAGTLSELAMASQLGRPILLLHGGGGWVDRLRDDDYLDQRCSVPLDHADEINQVVDWLVKLEASPESYGAINSGHLVR